MPRKTGPIPKYAKNMTELGGYLTPPRDRKILQLAIKREGNPGRTPDNRYEIAPWQAFIAANFKSAPVRDGLRADPDRKNLEMEKLKLQNQKLSFELDIKRKDYTANTEVEAWVGEMVGKARRTLLALPSKLAPQLLGADTAASIEKRLKSEINAALAELATKPLGQ